MLKTKSFILYLVNAVIAILLLINAVLIYFNSKTIEENKALQVDAEIVKANTFDIIWNIHLLDLAMRHYAITESPRQREVVDSATFNNPKIFKKLETVLIEQRFDEMERFHVVKDSVESYFVFINRLVNQIEQGHKSEVADSLRLDKGFDVWLAYKNFSNHINSYEDKIAAEAEIKIQGALRYSYLLQFFIFLLAVPTLGCMAFFAANNFKVSEDLRLAQIEKNRMLSDQNVALDKMVKEKTKDILSQNDEIKAHNDQLVLQQEKLKEAQSIIENQNQLITQKNKSLSEEVERQTNDLRETNNELIEQNTRLQQFTYIISHNLRAPLARLRGLANVMEATHDLTERENIYRLMINSSAELDNVILDLSTILNIQKLNTSIWSEVDLGEMIRKVLKNLEGEIEEVNGKFVLNLADKPIQSLAPYVESILYNLLSNAIKYRNPEKSLQIEISTYQTDQWMCAEISDNGLGIDLHKYKANLFNLYKRFHFHVEGKGLGLYLVKTEMEALGGRIEVESEVNKGTKFTLYFRL